MKDYADCMTTTQHHCKIGGSTIKDMARHNYRGLCKTIGQNMTRQDETELFRTIDYYTGLFRIMQNLTGI